MARKQAATEEDVSLFPFMDIITTVIGVLTLMIAAVSLEQLDTADVEMISEYEMTQEEIKKEELKQEELRKLINEKIGPTAALTRNQIELSEAEILALKKQLEETEKQLEALKEVKIVIPTLTAAMREKTSDMVAQSKTLQEELAQLELDISGKKDAPPANVSVLPSGSGLNFIPHFIECQDGALVLHDLNPPKTIRAANMATDKDFLQLVELAVNNPSNSIVFLIRSEGLNTFYAARKFCTDREVPNGKLPVVGKGKIDLSYFKKAMEKK
ncbi:hypothetical protein [Planctomicrobium sp. SH527]|uniref:hypothetical protein n=1 Tax=Planctomicrobium sp. SH527 TaxID=3448123 RepID=UPI003F5B0D02